jgi:hypothetical protein
MVFHVKNWVWVKTLGPFHYGSPLQAIMWNQKEFGIFRSRTCKNFCANPLTFDKVLRDVAIAGKRPP